MRGFQLTQAHRRRERERARESNNNKQKEQNFIEFRVPSSVDSICKNISQCLSAPAATRARMVWWRVGMERRANSRLRRNNQLLIKISWSAQMPTLREKLIVIINTHRTHPNWVRDHFDKCGVGGNPPHWWTIPCHSVSMLSLVVSSSTRIRRRSVLWVVGCRYCWTTVGRILGANRGKSQKPDTNWPPKTTIAATAASKQAMPVRCAESRRIAGPFGSLLN